MGTLLLPRGPLPYGPPPYGALRGPTRELRLSPCTDWGGRRSPQHWAGFRLLAGLSAGWLCRLLGLDFGLVSAGFRLGFRLDLDFDLDFDFEFDFDLSLILI